VANTTAIHSGSASPFPDSEYNITIVTEDFMGNVGIATVLFTVDTTFPTVNIDSPTATSYLTGNITVTLSGDADAYWYYITGVDSSNQTWTSTIFHGIYILHAYGNDSAGNEAHKSVTFTIGTPTTTIQDTATDTATTTTTQTKSGSFTGIMIILVYIISMVVAIRKRKKI
jgi:hypothetical protein